MQTKLFATLLFVFISILTTQAQSPQSIPYQAVARDSFGTPLPNQNMSLRLSVREGSSSGTVVYKETDSVTTNKLGMFTVNIGTGTVVTGTFAGINWSSGTKYLQVEVDPAGGTSYTDMGASQLMSVPFALYAQNSKQYTYANGVALTSDTVSLGIPAYGGLVSTYNKSFWAIVKNTSSTNPEIALGDIRSFGFSDSAVVLLADTTVISSKLALPLYGGGGDTSLLSVDNTGKLFKTSKGAALGIGSIVSSRIPYSNGSALTSDANFTRETGGGNTKIKVIKGGNYYSLSLGDSNQVNVGGTPVIVPSVALESGDTAGNYYMNMGVGRLPSYGLNQYGFMNLSNSAGNYAAIDFLESDGEPMVIMGANKGSASLNMGGSLKIKSDILNLVWQNSNNYVHGITADSLYLRLYSSTTDYNWTWPNTDGTNGQVLTTNGSGGLSWSGTGYALQFSSAAFNPADATTYYLGERGHLEPSTVSGTRSVIAPRSGKLKAVYIHIHVDGTFSSSSNTSVYVNINGTDYTVSSTAVLNTYRVDISNTSLSADVSAGNDVEIKVVTPTWSTNPTAVSFSGSLYIE